MTFQCSKVIIINISSHCSAEAPAVRCLIEKRLDRQHRADCTGVQGQIVYFSYSTSPTGPEGEHYVKDLILLVTQNNYSFTQTDLLKTQYTLGKKVIKTNQYNRGTGR